jgi:UDP-glucuronate decarboxylase
MKLNADKLKNLGWRPEIGLEEAYRRMIMGMKRECEG